MVLLTVTNIVTEGIKDFTQIAVIPDGIRPLDDVAIRMPINEHQIIANIGTDNLTLWVDDGATSGEKRWSSALYLAAK